MIVLWGMGLFLYDPANIVFIKVKSSQADIKFRFQLWNAMNFNLFFNLWNLRHSKYLVLIS